MAPVFFLSHSASAAAHTLLARSKEKIILVPGDEDILAILFAVLTLDLLRP